MASTNCATINNAAPGPLIFSQSPKEHSSIVREPGQTHLQKQFDATCKGIKSPVIKEVVEAVFASLARLYDILRLIEINTGEGGPLTVTLAAFALADHEAKSLIRFIEKKSHKINSIKGALRQALDGTSFVLRHELKKVFGQELSLLSSERKANQIRADVMRAHGLLSNCCQQSIIALARVFNPAVSGRLLFDDYRDRLEQSNVLIRDLSALSLLARQAGEKRDTAASELLIRELKAFCDGPLHYLMYKDWDEFEDIAREVTSSHGSARHGFILHCFGTYLEALLNQVQMRGVLNERASAVQAPKATPKRRSVRR